MDKNEEPQVIAEIQKEKKYPSLDYNVQLHHQHQQNLIQVQQNVIQMQQQNQNFFKVKEDQNNAKKQQQFVNQQPLQEDNKDSEIKFSLQHYKLVQDMSDIKSTNDLITESITSRDSAFKTCGFLSMILKEYFRLNNCNFVFKKNSTNVQVENACLFVMTTGVNSKMNQAFYASFLDSAINFDSMSQSQLNDYCNNFVNCVSNTLQIPSENVDIYRVMKDKSRNSYIIQFDYKLPQGVQIQNDEQKLTEGLKKLNQTIQVEKRNIIKDFVFTQNHYLHSQTLSYKKENFSSPYEERGIINGVKQRYSLPFGWTAFGINASSFSKDESWLKSDTSEETWPLGFIPGKIVGQPEIKEFDFTKDKDFFNQQPIYFGQLIYRNPEELQKHCHPFTVNDQKYIIAFQCRFDKKYLRVPSQHPNDYYVNSMQRATRPYRIILKKI